MQNFYVKLLGCLLCAALLAGCQTTPTDDIASIRFKIPPGSRLVLNQELNIPAERAHIVLQHGQAASGASMHDVACRFEVRDLGPRVIKPDSFLITSTSNQREWFNQPQTMRFYMVYHLKSDSQADIMPMVCEYFDWPMMGQPVTVAQVKEALGSYFTFQFASRATTP